jgi:sigma-B regulation protein RsbU (phosphoserine phosphatase)
MQPANDNPKALPAQDLRPSAEAVSQGVGDAVPANFRDLPWQERLAHVVDTMREGSKETDPQAMVRAYARRMRGSLEPGHTLSLSRRGLQYPNVRITRSTLWTQQLDPWANTSKLPIVHGGILAELMYADHVKVMQMLHVPQTDPAFDFFAHAKSAIAVPHFENGIGLNMVVHTAFREQAFDVEKLPDFVLQSNLFGRGTKNLVLARDLRETMEQLDEELCSVQEIQLSLLPANNPSVPGLDIATHYQTAKRAGGDYFDFFDLGDGRWGILVADVSGHGTPAAVLMAIVHAIAHQLPVGKSSPDSVMQAVNTALCSLYTRETGAFVTMWYGIYDSRDGTILHANAGHPAPLLREPFAERETHRTLVQETDVAHAGMPLGVMHDPSFGVAKTTLEPGQLLVLYTDGITEAFNKKKEMYGLERLFESVACGKATCSEGRDGDACTLLPVTASSVLEAIVEDVGDFAGLDSRSDDRTVIILQRSM